MTESCTGEELTSMMYKLDHLSLSSSIWFVNFVTNQYHICINSIKCPKSSEPENLSGPQNERESTHVRVCIFVAGVEHRHWGGVS
jgi:hypothetical protein